MEKDLPEQKESALTFSHKVNTPPFSTSTDNQSGQIQQLTLLDALPYPAWIKNRRAEYLYANEAYASTIGIPASTIKGRTDRQLFPKFVVDQLVDSDALVFHDKATVELNNICLRSIGTDTYWVSKSPLTDKQGRVTGIIGLMKRSSQSYSNSKDHHHLAAQSYQNSNEATIIADSHFNIIMANPAFFRITGFNETDIIGSHASVINTNWLAPEFMESITHNLRYHGYWEGETWNRKQDGQLYNEKIKISTVKSAEGNITHYIGQFIDNTEQKQAQEKLEFLAFHDELTGLANRALFLDRVSRSIQLAKRNNLHCAIIYIDLNEFKPLNDTHGHPFGDRVLIHVSKKLREAVRKVDTVSRQGGDEFAVLLEDAGSVENILLVTQKIISSLKQTIIIDEISVNIGASAGVSVYPDHGADADKLIGNADKAMYAAKFLGGNGYYLYK